MYSMVEANVKQEFVVIEPLVLPHPTNILHTRHVEKGGYSLKKLKLCDEHTTISNRKKQFRCKQDVTCQACFERSIKRHGDLLKQFEK